MKFVEYVPPFAKRALKNVKNMLLIWSIAEDALTCAADVPMNANKWLK